MTAPRAPRRAWQRPNGWLLVTGVGLVLAFAAIGWVQWRQVSLLSSTVRDEGDNLVWQFFRVESEFLQLRDQLRAAQLEPADPVRPEVVARVRQRFALFAKQLPLVQPQRVAHQVDFGQEHVLTMAALDAFVRQHAPVLAETATRPLTPQAALAALADLSALFEPVHSLSLRANQRMGENVTARNQAMRDQARLVHGPDAVPEPVVTGLRAADGAAVPQPGAAASATAAGGQQVAGGAHRGRGRQPGQERLSGQHEP